MVNINTAFPSTYLKEADLGGTPIIMTIEAIKFEDVSGRDEVKPVLYFREEKRGVVLNKTNANSIMEIVGTPETDAWKGWAVELFPFTTEFQGKMVPCIRIRRPTAQPVVAPVAGQPVAQPAIGQPQAIPMGGQHVITVSDPAPNTVAGDPGPQSATDHRG